MDGYQLSPVDVRVLGALLEKQALTPDAYPMTLNGLLGACNQLTSREPVMQLTDADLLAALDSLMAQKLVSERTPAGSRVAKYEHRLTYAWNIDGARLAALAMLMLRGAQTAAEIRARSGRIHAFASTEDVEQALVALTDKFPPMCVRLARQPGAREARWAHLLSGEPVVPVAQESQTGNLANGELSLRVAQLEEQVASLQTRLAALEARLPA